MKKGGPSGSPFSFPPRLIEMASSNPELSDAPALMPPVLQWLRLEGLAVVVLSAVLYAHTGAGWWLFAFLWLVPDLSMMGYWAGPRWGARCYNLVHSYLLPVALAIAWFSVNHAVLLSIALIWFNHIGVDRLLGYGLKYPAGFGFTHLSRLGKKPAPIEHVPSA
jgi:hypothetical protein